MKMLIYGYGNPGRKDDGIGIAMAGMMEEWIKEHKVSNVDVDTNYQLNIEDAEKISKYDIVVFIDATQEKNISNFILEDVKPEKDKIEFTMHAVSPAYILYLCKKLFDKNPDTKLLHIRGYRWEFKEGLSDSAFLNLERAQQFLICKIINWLKLKIPKNKCS
jgi:hydrogenase maturation protease